jgi:hypothetical protein
MTAAPVRLFPRVEQPCPCFISFRFSYLCFLFTNLPRSMAFSVTAALRSARNSHSTVQVRCNGFLPSFDWIATLAFHRVLLFHIQSVCDSLYSLRLLKLALSLDYSALFPAYNQFRGGMTAVSSFCFALPSFVIVLRLLRPRASSARSCFAFTTMNTQELM